MHVVTVSGINLTNFGTLQLHIMTVSLIQIRLRTSLFYPFLNF